MTSYLACLRPFLQAFGSPTCVFFRKVKQGTFRSRTYSSNRSCVFKCDSSYFFRIIYPWFIIQTWLLIIQVLPPPYTTLLSTEKENQQNGGVSTIKIINTDAVKRNACDDIIIDFNKFPLGTVDLINARSLSLSIHKTPMSFSTTTLVLIENSSSSSLSL